MTRDQLEHAIRAACDCLESHDLAASKLFAFREKDREFVTTLLKEGLIDSKTLYSRIAMLPTKQERKKRLQQWLDKTIKELD